MSGCALPSGDIGICIDPGHSTAYFVMRYADRVRLFDGSIPPPGWHVADFAHFAELLAYTALPDLDVSSAGLEPWFEQAQTAADAAYEERVETQQREREEFEARRVGRTAAELLAETPEMRTG